jgi:hypothetical protein
MILIEVIHTFDLGIVPYFMRAWTGKLKFSKEQLVQPTWILTQTQQQVLRKRLNNVQLPHGFS